MVHEAAAKRTVLTSSIDRQPSGAAMGFFKKGSRAERGSVSDGTVKGLHLLQSFETDWENTLSVQK